MVISTTGDLEKEVSRTLFFVPVVRFMLIYLGLLRNEQCNAGDIKAVEEALSRLAPYMAAFTLSSYRSVSNHHFQHYSFQ